jgi:polysaccharide export outer membrane protein
MIKRLFLLTAVALTAGAGRGVVAQDGSDAWFTPVPPATPAARNQPIQSAPAGVPPERSMAGTRVSGAANTNQTIQAAGAGLMDSLDNHYRLGPGDQILYQVIEDQDAPTNLTVTDSGDLEVPYYGLIHAAGKTCRRLAGQIKTLLEQKIYYQATVVVALEVANKAWVAGKVYVTGQVQRPGGYEIRAGENLTVGKAILDAGGFSDFSDKKHVRLVRKSANGDQTFVVNVLDVWKGQLNKDLPVQPGDLVVVPASMVNY